MATREADTARCRAFELGSRVATRAEWRAVTTSGCCWRCVDKVLVEDGDEVSSKSKSEEAWEGAGEGKPLENCVAVVEGEVAEDGGGVDVVGVDACGGVYVNGCCVG